MKKGEKAILGKSRDIYGNEISLDEFEGQKILLSFLRTAACPFCNLRVNEMIKKQREWEFKDVVIIAVFASPASEILKYAGKQNPSFAIIADPTESLYRKYGIEHSLLGKIKAMQRLKEMMQIMTKGYFNVESLIEKTVMPADFLINESGTIVQAYYGKDFGDHIPFEQVETWINSGDLFVNPLGVLEEYPSDRRSN
ncbi:MAG: redoxin domain-containing protein [Cyclobacteriaceae bacterium]|nr:redoxin domain-containing protein [Cyclobacteriaceae bacterium]